jgi:hypothetical protein
MKLPGNTAPQDGSLGLPVEGTTTWMVNQILEFSELARGIAPWESLQLRSSALLEFLRLHQALTSGAPLPEQWPQAAELATLRQRLADRETVEGWVSGLRAPSCARVLSITDFGPNNEGHQFELKLTGDDDATEEYEEFFQCFANSLDAAFHAAAEWVRGQS